METYKAMLCDCCLMAAVNADTSGHDYWCSGDPEPLSALESGHMVLGDNSGEYLDDCNGDYELAVEAATHEFCKGGCDGCGMDSAGRRTECIIEIREG